MKNLKTRTEELIQDLKKEKTLRTMPPDPVQELRQEIKELKQEIEKIRNLIHTISIAKK